MDWIRGKVLQVWRGICKFVNYLYSMCIGNYISRVKADPRSGFGLDSVYDLFYIYGSGGGFVFCW